MIAAIAFRNIAHRPLQALLSWVLLTAGVAIISLLLLLQRQLWQKFETNIRGIDLVMGAKGSPLQLILSSVYHLDNPTGNIDYAEAQKWMKNPMVESAIPLAYGDSYQGFPIVGSTAAYLEKYAAEVAEGQIFTQNFETVIGAEIARKTGLAVGSVFYGVHGTAAEGETHDEHPYRVTGILAPNGTVLDNLILCDIESVWKMHEHEHEHGDSCDHNHDDDHRREITAVLFKFRNPMAIVQWPRPVAEQTNMQLASPAVEMNRIFSLLGIGIRTLAWLGWAIIGLAALSVFIALFNTLKERRYELALLRTLGGSRVQVMGLILLESVWLCLAGFVSGIVVSRVALWLISRATGREYRFALDQFGFRWSDEGLVFLLVLSIGLLAALIPAQKAYRLDISKTLSHE